MKRILRITLAIIITLVAGGNISQAIAAKKKVVKPTPKPKPEKVYNPYLERVEKIVVIDSLSVPREDFFKSYKLPTASGRLEPSIVIPFPEARKSASMAFVNESGDYMMWAQQERDSLTVIHDAIRLGNGQWEEGEVLTEALGDGGNADYPFMLQDGTTLYFASNGKGSMGGYDIFFATRDPLTGKYLQPQNIGMPYNSEYDDYMLAIDEENGIGWWATDRNQLGDNITIYVYLTSDMRVNYDAETDDVEAKARISDYKSTWGDKDYSDKLALIEKIANKKNSQTTSGFRIPIGNGRFISSIAEIKDAEAKRALAVYLKSSEELKKLEEKLNQKRRYYNEGNKSLSGEISDLEKQVEKNRESANKMLSNFYKAYKGL